MKQARGEGSLRGLGTHNLHSIHSEGSLHNVLEKNMYTF
jgi:hypothetical protein